MSNATLAEPPPEIGHRVEAVSAIVDLARIQLHGWARLCDAFLDFQRRHILEAEPSDQELEQHRQGLKWLLRVTRLLHAEASDPDFPDHSLGRQLRIRLRQLEESWQMIHDPLPPAEAEAILKQVFPDKRRVGSPVLTPSSSRVLIGEGTCINSYTHMPNEPSEGIESLGFRL